MTRGRTEEWNGQLISGWPHVVLTVHTITRLFMCFDTVIFGLSSICGDNDHDNKQWPKTIRWLWLFDRVSNVRMSQTRLHLVLTFLHLVMSSEWFWLENHLYLNFIQQDYLIDDYNCFLVASLFSWQKKTSTFLILAGENADLMLKMRE